MKSSAASMMVLGVMMTFGGVAADGGDDRWKIVMAADFDSDGMMDVLWNDPHDNLVTIWLMAGAVLRAPGPIIDGPPGDGWSVTTADFNRDGMSDVLWSNADSNRFAVWFMNGATVLAPGPEIPGPAGDDWALASGESDFNADGYTDVVFRQAKTNLFTVWLMNGGTVLARGPALQGPIGDEWSVSTTADFNADGMGDIIWVDATNVRAAIWLMNGTALLARGPAISGPRGNGWTLVPSAGDVNFDGMADLVWTNDQPSLSTVWLMRGTSLLAKGPLVAGPEDEGWSVVTTGDMNGDGTTDLLWQADDPTRMAIWLMRGTSVAQAGHVIEGPKAP